MKRLLIFTVLLLVSCISEETKNLAEQVYENEQEALDGLRSDERIKEIQKEIHSLEKQLDREIDLQQRLGVWYRALGMRYIHFKMYFKAWEAFDKALDIYPDDVVLLYYRGLCAARVYASEDERDKKDEMLLRAVNSYEHSLKIDPHYERSLYALAVLYAFEMNREAEAAELLDRLLSRTVKNFEALFLRARLYVAEGESDRALELYEKVLKGSKNETHRERAKENIHDLMTGQYE